MDVTRLAGTFPSPSHSLVTLLTSFAEEENPEAKINILKFLPNSEIMNEVELSFVSDALDSIILDSQTNPGLNRVIEEAVQKFYIPMASLENIIDRDLLEYVIYFGKIKYSKAFQKEIEKGVKFAALRGLLKKRFPSDQKLVFV